MNVDSDDEISQLRAAALSTRPSNMRKRKVTLINPKENGTGENKRQIILNARKVVVGNSSGSQVELEENNSTSSVSDNDSDLHWPRAVMDSYAPKKPKLQNNRRILNVDEKQDKTVKDQRLFTVSEGKRNKGEVSLLDLDEDFEKDIRVILNDDYENETSVEDDANKKVEVIEIDDEGDLQNTTEILVSDGSDVHGSESNDEVEEIAFTAEISPLRKVEIESSEQRNEGDEIIVEGEEVDDEDNQDIVEEDKVGDDKKEQEGGNEEGQSKQVGVVEQEKNGKGNGKHVGVVEQVKNGKGNGKEKVKEAEKGKSGSQRQQKVNEQQNIVKDGKSAENTNKKDESKQRKTEKPKSEERSENPENNQKTAEIKNVAKKEKKSDDHNSDDESSGSESNSSRSSDSSSSSGSSSSNSNSSSSSRTSSDSRSSSGSDSDSDNDKKSRNSKHSSRSSSHSSSYSYSTGGSAEKNTMRSVISHKKDTRRSRSPRRSPPQSSRDRWSPRDRRYSDRRRSYDRDDRYRRDRYNRDVRPSRDDTYSRRRSPHSRLGRRPSPPRDYRRDINRSRERDRSRDTRFNRSDERLRRRRSHSRSVEKKNDSSDKNNLSRTDDDFVEIDVKEKTDIRKSRLKMSGRLGKKRVDANVCKPGFDLRSRLGPKKSEKKLVITKKIRVVTRQKQTDVIEVEDDENGVYVDDGEQNGNDDDDEYETPSSLSRNNVVEVKDDKEAELDEKISRIQKMNEEIRKRREEVEREKLLYD